MSVRNSARNNGPHSNKLRRAWVGLAVAAAATILACASARGRSKPDVPVDIEIQNNLAIPTQLTVYIVTGFGNRQLLGDVQSGTTRTFQFTPASRSETYQLLARRALAREIRSQPFIVGSTMTGTIVWALLPNMVGFRDVDSDSTGSK